MVPLEGYPRFPENHHGASLSTIVSKVIDFFLLFFLVASFDFLGH
jgi:hypothetical protein